MSVEWTRDSNPEIALGIATLCVALVAGRWGSSWLGWWERPLSHLARKKMLAILISGIAPLVLRAALLPRFPIPEPRIHDEFTFLLGADTLADGRVANPQHPFWVHFESPHILARPKYASAFPMAQSVALALGKRIGHPWLGVWLSAGFMCAAICWMLQGWVPPRWALLGAILAVLRFGVSSYWMNSYWGGFVAAAGGALVLGALPRLIRSPHWSRALAMGVGLAILANSRSFEGAIFGLATAAVLIAWVAIERSPPWAVIARHVILPIALLLAVTGVAMGYGFARVTGKPWVAPYVLYRESMTMAPHFIWQSPSAEPLYNNRELRNFYVYWEMSNYEAARRLRALWDKAGAYWRFYFGPLLTIPLMAALFLWRNRKTRWLLPIGAGILLALAGQVWYYAHYAAPAAGLAILLVIQGMRALRTWRPPIGLNLIRCLPVACAAMLLIQTTATPSPDVLHARNWRWPPPGGVARARILKQLQASAEKQLVLVRYERWHDPGDEWVYNDADIDRAQVVWARELDPASNAALMRYFGDRRRWLMEPDLPAPRLRPYADAPFRPMPFVQLGAPGIDVLRSAAEVRRKVVDQAHGSEDTRFTCDGWNYFFTQATRVAAPTDPEGCFPEGDRTREVSLEHWFAWIERQRY